MIRILICSTLAVGLLLGAYEVLGRDDGLRPLILPKLRDFLCGMH